MRSQKCIHRGTSFFHQALQPLTFLIAGIDKSNDSQEYEDSYFVVMPEIRSRASIQDLKMDSRLVPKAFGIQVTRLPGNYTTQRYFPDDDAFEGYFRVNDKLDRPLMIMPAIATPPLRQRRTIRASILPVLLIRETGLGFRPVMDIRTAAEQHEKNDHGNNSEFHRPPFLIR
jgi:hypothetical protein